MSAQEDFSEDTTNGGFEQQDEMNLNADQADLEMMTQGGGVGGGGAGDGNGVDEASAVGMNQDDSMGAAGENGGGGEEMDSGDTGSADQYGKDDDRKLFVGGLSWETTEKDLKEYFGKYGGIESLTLKMDPSTGRSRGFAFIVFSEVPSLDNVIAAGEHVIQGKKVDPKKAKARHGKIFVGGLTTDISDDDIKNYFTQYGNVVEMEMPIDKSKNQRKGFCFITFDNEQIVHELLKKPKQVINGKEVDVKKAQPPQSARGGMSSWGGSMAGGRGGRGGGGGMRGRGGRGRGTADYYGGGYGGYGQGYGSYGGYGDYSGYGGYGGSGYDSYYGGGYTGYDGYGYDGYESGPPISRGTRGTSTRGGLNLFQGDSNNEVGLNEVLNRGIRPTDRRSSNSRSSGPSNSSTSLLGQHNKNPRSFSHLNNWRSSD